MSAQVHQAWRAWDETSPQISLPAVPNFASLNLAVAATGLSLPDSANIPPAAPKHCSREQYGLLDLRENRNSNDDQLDHLFCDPSVTNKAIGDIPVDVKLILMLTRSIIDRRQGIHGAYCYNR
jgi:hypothetical protein